MTVTQAKKICRRYYGITNPTEEDTFLYTEALQYLIEETKDDGYMAELGGVYYEARNFDLALKYYGLAAEHGNLDAVSCLGYIWYYGRTGTVDYEKAFHYFDRACRAGDIVAAYKVADMYKNGYFVKKDPRKYRLIIEGLYPKVKNARMLGEPLPEIFTRLAKIRAGEGKTREALRLYGDARCFLAQRIRCHPFFGDLNIMKWMIEDIYRLRPFDPDHMDVYDLYYLLTSPVTVTFRFEEEPHEVKAVEEDGAAAVCFDGRWFRTVDDFFREAQLDGEKLTARYDELYSFEVK